MRRARTHSLVWPALLAAAGFAGQSAPAAAQSTVEELTVTGHMGKAPAEVHELSAPVSYADLDLSTKAGKDELERRIRLTARYLCEKLGEPRYNTMGPSCHEAAERQALARASRVEDKFASRGDKWAAGPAWTPPYPAEWDKAKR